MNRFFGKEIYSINCFAVALLAFFTLTFIANANANAEAVESGSPNIKPYPDNVFWGDTHVHTSLSVDGNMSGNKTLGPDAAYRFAKGETVTAHNGMPVKLARPLDFIVIADHALSLGFMNSLEAGDSALRKTLAGSALYQQWQSLNYNPNQESDLEALIDFKFTKIFPLFDASLKTLWKESDLQGVWRRYVDTADQHNDPGGFTALIGYEWTSPGDASAIDLFTMGNLHRVVVFKDGGDNVRTIRPFSTQDSANPEDLWHFMEGYERDTGGEVIAIPHNGNLSRGAMFALKDFKGQPLNADYAKARMRWEPLYEVTQMKGDSETHPILSPNDPFADFETWHSWFGRDLEAVRKLGWIDEKKSEYARSALKRGLKLQSQLSANPFKFGMIGSTDSHTSLATADDNNYWGKVTSQEPNTTRFFKENRYAANGYAGVWATENTREALFAAMKRKEVYASTGPRINVRFFGGWDYHKQDAASPDMAKIGYKRGVPMGSDLASAPVGAAPSFLIRAVKDPDSANLDRVQVIKGWLDVEGNLNEKIYNVALSDNRKPNSQGEIPPVGNTVNIADASYTNTIGDTELSTVWVDPDFDPAEYAFYYLRVLEIPTPRWTAYDAKYFQFKKIPAEVPMVTQERAYSSPIWYSP